MHESGDEERENGQITFKIRGGFGNHKSTNTRGSVNLARDEFIKVRSRRPHKIMLRDSERVYKEKMESERWKIIQFSQ